MYLLFKTFVNRAILVLFVFVSFISCTKKDPTGNFKGEIKDWVHEVFEGSVLANNKLCQITVIFKQLPQGQLSTLLFKHPDMTEVVRNGKWEVEDGYRSITFSDDKQPSKYFLIKKGVRYAFQTKEGLANDDGSPILLMRNEGKSRKMGYPFKIFFGDDKKVKVKTLASNNFYSGEWKWNGSDITVTVKLHDAEDFQDLETYKYFLSWTDNENALLLKKMLITRPFKNKDGSMRQSWMSSLVFPEKPKLSSF